jgi:hypothetical protein
LHAADPKSIKALPITPEDGIFVITFLFNEPLDKYGKDILEVAMNSTCMSNNNHMKTVELTSI